QHINVRSTAHGPPTPFETHRFAAKCTQAAPAMAMLLRMRAGREKSQLKRASRSIDLLRRLGDYRPPDLLLLEDESRKLLGRGRADVSAEVLEALLDFGLREHGAQIGADLACEWRGRAGRRHQREPTHRLEAGKRLGH